MPLQAVLGDEADVNPGTQTGNESTSENASSVTPPAVEQAIPKPPPRRAVPPGTRLDPVRIYVEAGATPGQEREIRAMVRDYELLARVKIARTKNMLTRLHKMSLEITPDENTVIALQEEINKLQGEIALDRTRLMLKLRNILNEEQRTKLSELMQTQPAAGATAHDAQ